MFRHVIRGLPVVSTSKDVKEMTSFFSYTELNLEIGYRVRKFTSYPWKQLKSAVLSVPISSPRDPVLSLSLALSDLTR